MNIYISSKLTIRFFSTKSNSRKHRLILLSNGRSEWFQQGVYAGWYNVPLSKRSQKSAGVVGQLLRRAEYEFDEVISSPMERAVKTLAIILAYSGHKPIPFHTSWKLNDRHYGAVTGLKRQLCFRKFGNEARLWESTYDVSPPPMFPDHPLYSKIITDKCYKDGPDVNNFPVTETLRDVFFRVVSYWNDFIEPKIAARKRLLLVLHPTSLKSVLQYLNAHSEAEMVRMRIPGAVPFAFFLDENLRAVPGGNLRFLGEPELVKKVLIRFEQSVRLNYRKEGL